MPFLHEINTHPLDAILQFTETDHRYEFVPTGQTVRKSMTGVLKPYFDTFDGAKIARSGVAKWLRNDSNKYHQLCLYLKNVCEQTEDEIAHTIASEHWPAIGNLAAVNGTRMHRTLELLVQGELDPPSAGEEPPHCIAAYAGWRKKFYPDMELVPWRVELSIVLTTEVNGTTIPVVAGQIDLVLKDKNGRFWLVDWKSTDARKKGKIGSSSGKRAFPSRKAAAPFEAFDSDDFSKYSAQLLGYKYMMEHGGYCERGQIAGAFIVQIHDALDEAHCIEAGEGLGDEFEDAVGFMMEREIEAAKRQHSEKVIA